MPKNPKVDVGCNVQEAVGDKYKLIVEQDVTNAVTDVDQLTGMAIKAKETLGVDQMKVVRNQRPSLRRRGSFCQNMTSSINEVFSIDIILKNIPALNSRAGI